MNLVLSFVSIVALLLALGGVGNIAPEQAEVNPSAARQINPSKIALNHNETMVSDYGVIQPADSWSQWLASMQTFILNSFSSDAPGRKGGCEDWGCGTNHNETMVRDASR